MLKIKDSVDLKELEKFGFRKHKQDAKNVLTSKWTRNWVEAEWSDGHKLGSDGYEFYPLIIITENRKLVTGWLWSWDKVKVDKLIQDLIQADLVEKVEE